MKKDPRIIRVGDYVTVTNPQIFRRCGYPLCKSDMSFELDKFFSSDVQQLVDKIANMENSEAVHSVPDYTSSWKRSRTSLEIQKEVCKSKIKEALVSLRLVAKKFGGNERKIYTDTKPEYLDQKCKVYSIRFIKTGTRVSGYSGTNCYGENDSYEPPCLTGEKTHKILSVAVHSSGTYTFGHIFEIESCNVSKVMEEICIK